MISNGPYRRPSVSELAKAFEAKVQRNRCTRRSPVPHFKRDIVGIRTVQDKCQALMSLRSKLRPVWEQKIGESHQEMVDNSVNSIAESSQPEDQTSLMSLQKQWFQNELCKLQRTVMETKQEVERERQKSDEMRMEMKRMRLQIENTDTRERTSIRPCTDQRRCQSMDRCPPTKASTDTTSTRPESDGIKEIALNSHEDWSFIMERFERDAMFDSGYCSVD